MNSEFWEMGGYALYVWGSYGAGLAIFAWNVAAPALARRGLRQRLQQARSGEGA
jgi:heme exporter protein CcmD